MEEAKTAMLNATVEANLELVSEDFLVTKGTGTVMGGDPVLDCVPALTPAAHVTAGPPGLRPPTQPRQGSLNPPIRELPFPYESQISAGFRTLRS